MATADGLALDLLSVAQEIGVRVPEDLAVMGFGGTDESAHSWPTLSTVGHPFEDFGQQAVATLKEVQQTGQRQPDVVLEVELTARRSCGCTEDTPDGISQDTQQLQAPATEGSP